MQIRFWGPLLGGLALSVGCGGSTLSPVGGGPTAGAGGAGSSAAGANSNFSGAASSVAGTDAAGASANVAGANSNFAGAASSVAGANSGVAGADSSVAGSPGSVAYRVAGTWKGYVENYHFADGSDALELGVDEQGAGHLTVGASPAPAPPSRFDVGYPPALTPAPQPGATPGVFAGLDPGFSFTVHNVLLAAARIQFDVAGSDLSAVWCQHQTPASDAQGHYTCVPNGNGIAQNGVCSTTNPTTTTSEPLDCGKYVLCSLGVCLCTASACVADPTGTFVHFDLRNDGTNANGSATGLDTNLHNVYLTWVAE